MNDQKLKVLWCLDAFDDLKKAFDEEHRILSSFAQRGSVEIDPVYVLSPVELGVSTELAFHWAETYSPSAKRALEQKLKDYPVAGLRDPIVLVQNSLSLRRAIDELANFAKANAYDLILLGSHGREGLERAILGSFAEGLLTRSEVPVLVVGRSTETKVSKNPEVLIPSDLKNTGSTFFKRAFKIAKYLNHSVSVLHVIPRPLDPVIQSGVFLLSGGWVPAPIYLSGEEDKSREAYKAVSELAEQMSVTCKLIVDADSTSVVESIVRTATQNRVSMIVMAAESGPVSAAILGSLSRKTVRLAPCPTLTIRSG